jgi:hypothetical protein
MNRFTLGIALFIGLVACGGDAGSRQDLESLAIQDTIWVGLPQVERGTVVHPVSTQAAPTPRAEPVRGIPAGTLLTLEVREDLSTSSHRSGDAFHLRLVDAVTGTGGGMLPAGTPARGLITEARSATGPDAPSVLGLRVGSIEIRGSQRTIHREVGLAEVEPSTVDSGTRTAAATAAGAATGTSTGQIPGRDIRSTAAGAAAGTAVGVGVALMTRGGHATLPAGSRIILRLDRDLVF